MSATNFLPPIPDGYQILKRMLLVSGITFRKIDATFFIRSGCETLELEREPNNPKDKNAIKVMVLHQMYCEISRNVREFRFSNTPMPS